jgi:hypothetical protein
LFEKQVKQLIRLNRTIRQTVSFILWTAMKWLNFW